MTLLNFPNTIRIRSQQKIKDRPNINWVYSFLFQFYPVLNRRYKRLDYSTSFPFLNYFHLPSDIKKITGLHFFVTRVTNFYFLFQHFWFDNDKDQWEI